MRKRRSYKKVCDLCGEKKQDARKRIDPYIKDLQERTVKRVLCKECFQELNLSI